MTDHTLLSDSEKRPTRNAALAWLKTQKFGPPSEIMGKPSLSLDISADPDTAIKHIDNLSQSLNKPKYTIIFSPDRKNVKFIGEDMLMYMVRKDVRFEGDEDYIRRFRLGEDLMTLAHSQIIHIVHGKTPPNIEDEVQDYIKDKAYFNTRDKDQDTALFYFAAANDLSSAKIALEQGIDANASNKMDETALHFMIHFLVDGSHAEHANRPNPADYVDMVRMLREYGADRDKKAPGKKSALEEARALAVTHPELRPIVEALQQPVRLLDSALNHQPIR